MKQPHRYRFARAAQWAAGDLARAAPADGGFTLAPAWGQAIAWQRSGAVAAAIGPERIAAWNDGASTLWVGEPTAEPERRTVPPGLAKATHLEATRDQFWAADAKPQLRVYTRDVPVLSLQIDLRAERILDLCGDGNGGVWALVVVAGNANAIRVDCVGKPGEPVPLPMPCGLPRALTWLGGRLLLLDATGSRLLSIDPRDPTVARTVSLRSVRPGVEAVVLASDSERRVLVGGVDCAAFGGGAFLLEGDVDGEITGAIELPAPPRDVACRGGMMLVTTDSAVWRFAADPSGASRAVEASASFVTPLLFSPQVDSGPPWLRAEVEAFLPEGATLELSWAASDIPETVAAARATLADGNLDPATRRQRLREQLDWSSPLRLSGAADAPVDASRIYALPLHDVRARSLWLSVALIAAPGVAAPRIRSLEVLYPGDSLMQYLPAIYRRQADQPGDFLRTLVAVLETSVHGLDDRIAGLGRLLDPRFAPEAWLDAIARWLGLPWDDMLPIELKRNLLARAPQLLEGRGTRAGLQALLDVLAPQGKASVVDVGVERGFARLGDASAAGTRLPAMLSGWPGDAMVLNAKACLGRGRIADPQRLPEPMAWLSGRVDIEVQATPEERRSWAPRLGSMVDAMTPLTARTRLRWRSPNAPLPVPLLDDTLILPGVAPARLGTGAALGSARLEPRRGTTLDDAGASPGLSLD